MHADLERVINLQQLDTKVTQARKTLAEAPEREKAFDERLTSAKSRLADAKAALAASQEARRAIEKEVAVHQGRLSKYRDQAMAVKTNEEYHAVQKEISYAQTEIKALEDRVLEQMLEADELTAAVKLTERELSDAQIAAEATRKAM